MHTSSVHVMAVILALAGCREVKTVSVGAGPDVDRGPGIEGDIRDADGPTPPREPAPPDPDREPPRPEPPRAEDCGGFVREHFDRPADAASCDGPRFVAMNERYGLLVGVEECEGGARFYLADPATRRFLPATDTAGHGQDLCELVDPSFRIPNEDDITSGGCTECSIGRNVPLEGVAAYSRSTFGQAFELVERTSTWSWQVGLVHCGLRLADRCDAPPTPPRPVTGMCGGGGPAEMSGYRQAADSVAMHVIGVYEGSYPDGVRHSFGFHPEGVVDVVVNADDRPIALVLSSYEPVEWRIHVSDGARIERVLLRGYHAQRATGLPAGTSVTSVGHEGTGANLDYAYGTDRELHNSGGGNFEGFIASVRAQTGLTEASFQGCYTGIAFEVGGSLGI